MRDPSFGSRRSTAITLVIINVAIFVVQTFVGFWRTPNLGFLFGDPSSLSPTAQHGLLPLSQYGLAHGFIWQLVTYQFLHAGLLHLLVNMILVYFFGRAIEDALGRRTLLRIYLFSGIVGGLVQILYQAVLQKFIPGPAASVVGASASGLGLLAAYATLFPHREITLLLFFFIPVSLRARTLLCISLGLAVFGMIIPMNNVAEAAHLGGILTGLAYIHWIVQGTGWSFGRPAARPRVLVTAPSPKKPFWQRSKTNEIEDLPPAEFISREVDPILDKISAQGIQSLTERERRILEAARAKMAKR
jgi:membrane associated rhomboid family serine protease